MTQTMATPSFAKASEGKQKKIDTVNALTQKIERAKSVVFVEYGNLKHKQLEQLRKEVKKADAEFVVTKNKLMERSLGDVAPKVKSELKDATASLFSYGDEVSGLKAILAFFKKANVGKTKGGLLGQTVLTTEDVDKLAKLPGKQDLLGQLVCQMKSPLYGLHRALQWNINTLVWGLNNIKNKKLN